MTCSSVGLLCERFTRTFMYHLSRRRAPLPALERPNESFAAAQVVQCAGLCACGALSATAVGVVVCAVCALVAIGVCPLNVRCAESGLGLSYVPRSWTRREGAGVIPRAMERSACLCSQVPALPSSVLGCRILANAGDFFQFSGMPRGI